VSSVRKEGPATGDPPLTAPSGSTSHIKDGYSSPGPHSRCRAHARGLPHASRRLCRGPMQPPPTQLLCWDLGVPLNQQKRPTSQGLLAISHTRLTRAKTPLKESCFFHFRNQTHPQIREDAGTQVCGTADSSTVSDHRAILPSWCGKLEELCCSET